MYSAANITRFHSNHRRDSLHLISLGIRNAKAGVHCGGGVRRADTDGARAASRSPRGRISKWCLARALCGTGASVPRWSGGIRLRRGREFSNRIPLGERAIRQTQSGPERRPPCCGTQSDQSRCRDAGERPAVGRQYSRAFGGRRLRKRRSGFERAFRLAGRTTGWRHLDWRRPGVHEPERRTRTDYTPIGPAGNSPNTRVRTGRRLDELHWRRRRRLSQGGRLRRADFERGKTR